LYNIQNALTRGVKSLGVPLAFCFGVYMQQVQTHYRWFLSFRRLQMSAFLVSALLVFAFTNASLLLLAKGAQDVQAQTTPSLVVKEKAPKPTETTQTPSTPPAQETPPTPAPKPAAARATTPAPAYDKVSIPSIGLSSRFVTVGTTSANTIDVHPTLVGWWNGSARPGTPGAVFLDGHNPGVFRKLPSVQVGAQISLSKANGEVFNYTVVHIETVQLAGINMVAALNTYGDAREGLNLMTCVGTYNSQTGTTDQRLVVYAVRA